MKIGVPREIKNHEYRVGLTPGGVAELVSHGHSVTVETGAGLGVGFTDEAYKAAGASLAPDADILWAGAEMIVKVKEPQAVERQRLKPEHVLFAYLHLAPDPEQTDELIASGATCIAFETVTDARGQLPLLVPMSEVAGRLSVQAGAHALEKAQGGVGVLLGGVPGVAPGRVVVIGGGTVGVHAAQMAAGLGADVTIFDRSLPRLAELSTIFNGRVKTLYSTKDALAEAVRSADLVIGAVLIPGAAAPKLLTREMLRTMRPGSVVVDVAIDQGGCFETSRATTHQNPTYVEEGIVHYCVANMPGAVARTSTLALENATLPYTIRLADKGWQKALSDDPGFANGLNVCQGKVTYQAVAKALGHEYHPAKEFLNPWWQAKDAGAEAEHA